METTASDYVVGLDIGSSRTRCLIAEVTDGGVRIIGRGDEISRGVRRGEVIELAAATYAVGHAIAGAEQQAGLEIQTLFLATGSRHVSFFNNRACIGITREERTITPRDVQEVSARARLVPARPDTFPISSLVCSYAVDDVRRVREPLGMHGTRLEAEAHVILDIRSSVENMAACLNGNHEIEEYAFAPHAAAEAVLEEDEKDLGTAVIDIGAGTTGIVIYRDGVPVFSSVVPVGGDHITNDIAMGMDLGLADATQLKEEHAMVGPAPVGSTITFQRFSKGAAYCVEPRRLYAIVDCRVREILDIVRREFIRAGVRSAAVRAVLTGGTARMPGIDSIASAVLGCPVRIGKPALGGKMAMGPEMATVAGLLLIGKQARLRQPAQPVAAGAGKFLTWLRQLF